MDRGILVSRKSPSESMTAAWSVGTPRGSTGVVPVAITKRSARKSPSPAPPVTRIVWGSSKAAWPSSTSTPLRPNWAR